MNLEDLLIRKEEIFLGDGKTYFQIPVHHALFSADSVPRMLAYESFATAFFKWCSDLEEYAERLAELRQEKAEELAFMKRVYVDRKLKLKKELVLKKNKGAGKYEIRKLGWQSNADFHENGLARGLSLNMNCSCLGYVPELSERTLPFENPFFIQMSSEKLKEYESPEKAWLTNREYALVMTYDSSHNVDTHPQALFLRRWGVEYFNEAMKTVFSENSQKTSR